MQNRSRTPQKSPVYAGAGIHSIQSPDDRLLSAVTGKRKKREGDCLCDYAETGSRDIRSPEIGQNV